MILSFGCLVERQRLDKWLWHARVVKARTSAAELIEKGRVKTERIAVESVDVVADPDDPASIVAAIREMRANPEKLREMGRKAREKAREFDREEQLRLLLEIVEGAI